MGRSVILLNILHRLSSDFCWCQTIYITLVSVMSQVWPPLREIILIKYSGCYAYVRSEIYIIISGTLGTPSARPFNETCKGRKRAFFFRVCCSPHGSTSEFFTNFIRFRYRSSTGEFYFFTLHVTRMDSMSEFIREYTCMLLSVLSLFLPSQVFEKRQDNLMRKYISWVSK